MKQYRCKRCGEIFQTERRYKPTSNAKFCDECILLRGGDRANKRGKMIIGFRERLRLTDRRGKGELK